MERLPPRAPDTIAAVATAPGRGGIGVVRVSGSGLLGFAQALCGRQPQPRLAQFSRFVDGEGRPIDEGILLYFPAPASFTGEDVLELQGHGGPVVMQLLLERCLGLGARLAEPGEFTRRAFLNGKLDLAQAEGVADLIEASTAAAARSAVRSLSGRFSEEVHRIVDRLVDLRMLVEATLDFPEEEIEFLERARAMPRLEGIRGELEALLDRAGQGALLRSGLNVVLVGAPNVGKSSLLNQLAGEERAIVTDIAGTTRDALRETIQIEGIPLHVIDTAGLRDTADTVERLGIERTWREIERADVIVRLVDASVSATGDDELAGRLPGGVERITVVNKIDLVSAAAGREEQAGQVTVRVSARTGEGVDLLRAELLRVAGWHAHGEDVVLARERHLQALRMALGHVCAAGEQLAALELFAEELRLAQERLGEITGEFGADDLLGEIFSRFCIGK
ncbi:MAG TPA: tRNA uridine-5-carboxymethylaminomethyl(34) synthesis GTPase MnmE [Thauera sp.]|uniref:tRNA uridine-5-carboxymethylaminomethyl(34) synthesis GTPase MnmE n=1 Tax=unclassified Thauera TaxID=2609274 RepID=UPI0002D13893|nr:MULTISPECIES: tRNA uridine-5-carboxymethylaminomethyl(34) synthesis GTPase MnmE [unclassified Thauera]HAG74775.1 tRNA uridine-5-carboxymethylaminomethyl(34) synthesis GTPase MnmE [Thauera sp.]ENO93709.1 tRNA modification GTPase TrmE [Thauera sp. 28]WBL64243.1 tRNA uridine-5-carboxymethylaminomethyl(34) synthesis GTPase MnmE [Thauera sp. WB-2]HAY11288.1 tRNA uridine-5-carboxymethylaminomethyl(34) synthesis GTPase MnmE [Thauera sp.]HNR60153.1 tRNA uridine-5-carboxymethylaminomethyl(34) synthe